MKSILNFVITLFCLLSCTKAYSDSPKIVETENGISVEYDGNSTVQPLDESIDTTKDKGPVFVEKYAGDKYDYKLKSQVLDKLSREMSEMTKAGVDLDQLNALAESANRIHGEIKACIAYNILDAANRITMKSRVTECKDYFDLCDVTYSFLILNIAEYNFKKNNFAKAKQLYRELIVNFSGDNSYAYVVKKAQIGLDDIPR